MYINLTYNVDWDFDGDYSESLIDKYNDIYTYEVDFDLEAFYVYLKENNISISNLSREFLGDGIVDSIKLDERPEYQQISYIYSNCELKNNQDLYDYLLNKYKEEAEEDWLDYIRSEEGDKYDY